MTNTNTPLEHSERFKPPATRRDFLGLAASWSAILAFVMALLGAMRLPMPSVFPESNPRVKLGRPRRFAVEAADLERQALGDLQGQLQDVPFRGDARLLFDGVERRDGLLHGRHDVGVFAVKPLGGLPMRRFPPGSRALRVSLLETGLVARFFRLLVSALRLTGRLLDNLRRGAPGAGDNRVRLRQTVGQIDR
ncbi:MAG: hypothetical protein IIC02_08710, partial [Planctomycetes bacterium]|nr:hypothetical protein [Planctomycetota bacterium]